MGQYQLNWFAAPVMVNLNATGQQAVYRRKSTGGAYLTTGFTPSNPLLKTTEQVTSGVLADNILWQFKVQALCTVGGPTDNDNGPIEGMKFACLTPSLSWDKFDATITLNVGANDVESAIFTLHLASDDSVIDISSLVARVGSAITYQATGLTDDTEYYWTYVMKNTVNGVLIASSDADQLGTSCVSIDFMTDPDVCLPITDVTVEAEETA